jgi:basic membrane protein A and related proteins
MKKRTRVLGSLLALTFLAAACGSSESATDGAQGGSGAAATTKDRIDVAFVYIGPTGDAGWTKRHDDGAKALEKALGDKVKVTRLESIGEGAASVAEFERLGREGYDLVFGTSFGYMDPMLDAANKFPNTCYQHASGYKTAPNLGTYFGAAEEARYLTGIAAAKASKSGKLGYVAAFPIPEVIRGINAFTLGAQSVNPNSTVQVVWTSTWFDPDKERRSAESLLQVGVDVVTQHQDTPAAGEAAQEKGAKWIGYNDDMSRFVPDAWLTGMVWDWSPYYISAAESVLGGACPNGQYYGSMADGMITLAAFGASVDGTAKQLINEKAAAITDGSLKPFTGPVLDQSGAVRVPAGVDASLEELLSMDYFVKGVIGDPAGS